MRASKSLRRAAVAVLSLPLLSPPLLAQTGPVADGRPASGFYAGGHVGYLFGNATATLLYR